MWFYAYALTVVGAIVVLLRRFRRAALCASGAILIVG